MSDNQNLRQRFDVAVVGGGPAGIGAAVAAARTGARTLLAERHDVLGGMCTAALVNNFCPAHLDHTRLIIGGVFAELRRRLIDRRSIYASPNGEYRMEPYDPDVFAEQSASLCLDAGVTVMAECPVSSVVFRGDGLASLAVRDRTVCEAGVVVDATGDATVAAQAGVPCTFGRQRDGAVMPLTYCYMIGEIDLDRLANALPGAVRRDGATGDRYCVISNHPKTNEWVAKARGTGELSIPRDHIAGIQSIPGRPTYATVNFGRVFCPDPTDPEELARAEARGRRQIDEGIRFFRKYLPGFERVELQETARQIGVRESRQIRGLYTLTEEDATGCRQFDDVVAQCCYSIDIHEPDSDRSTLRPFAPGTHFDIPWRCLVPAQGPPNLIVGGRCISATQGAMSSFRVSPSAMATGEAAGVTAALAAIQEPSPAGSSRPARVRDVDPARVQERLLATGAILG